MSHEIETMAFANEVPWHGLGNRIDASATVDEMLDAAGLNWEVKRVPIFAQAPNGERINLPLKRALMRLSDNKVLSVVGDVWKPLQNKQALEFFRDYTESGGAKLETAGSLRGGRTIWALASIQEGFTINGNDTTKGYILLVSPHEVGKKITVRTTSVRVVCANTMALAMKHMPQYSQNHLSKFDVSRAKETIGLAREQIHQAHLDAEKLSELKLGDYDRMRFLSQFFQPAPEGEKEIAFIEKLLNDPREQDKKLASVLHSVEKAPGAVPGTGWGILNGVTHWADHIAGNKPETRLFNAWMGSNAQLKLDVKDALLQLV
jgi:phage/plasmid-like protein (TIGR03299 family)